MKTTMIVLEWILSVGVFGLYYKSSTQKLRNPYSFVRVVDDYQIFSLRMTSVLAPILSVTELLAGIWLVLPWTRLVGAVIGSLFQILFMILMIKNLGKTFPNGCGCFEMNSPKTITGKHVLLNFVILVSLAFIIVSHFMGWEAFQWNF